MGYRRPKALYAKSSAFIERWNQLALSRFGQLRGRSTMPQPIVFLVDVDNTLLDNDRIQRDLRDHLELGFGAAARDRYWAILEELS